MHAASLGAADAPQRLHRLLSARRSSYFNKRGGGVPFRRFPVGPEFVVDVVVDVIAVVVAGAVRVWGWHGSLMPRGAEGPRYWIVWS